MVFSWRARSRTQVTSSRISRKRAQRSPSRGSFHRGSAFGQSARCTLEERRPGRCCHSSSAVKLKIGAMSRVSFSRIRFKTVWAERLAGASAAEQ